MATALLVFLLIDFVRLTINNPVPSLMTVMDALVYVALAVAIWRPRLGLGLAAIPLITALFWPSTSLEALLLTAATALGLSHLRRRAAVGVSLTLVAYVALRILLYPGEAATMLGLSLGASAVLGLGLGWAGLTLRERRERAQQSAAYLATENARIRADERRTLSRELHDVIAHQLSTASLQVMATQGVSDPASLQRALKTIDRATSEALTELRLLVRVLRDDPTTSASGNEIRELNERVPPTQAAAAAELSLLLAGFEPDVVVPARADDLEMTVQRTISRVLREAVDNVINHAPAKSRCVVRLAVSDQQVSLQVRNPVPADSQRPKLGWGLRGLRERAELTGGSLLIDTVGAEWVVSLTLPRS